MQLEALIGIKHGCTVGGMYFCLLTASKEASWQAGRGLHSCTVAMPATSVSIMVKMMIPHSLSGSIEHAVLVHTTGLLGTLGWKYAFPKRPLSNASAS